MSNFCIMNVDKQSRSAVFGLQIEANRKEGDGREFDRSDIDKEKTKDNIFLRECDNWNAEVTRQLRVVGVKERKNSKVLITGVYSMSPEWLEKHTKDEAIQYFKACLDFHDRTYGKAFNAVIHMDETTAHMQVASVPLMQKADGWHLTAKEIMGGRMDYQKRQDLFYEEVGKRFGMDRGERRDAAHKKTHTKKQEWEEAELDAQIQAKKGAIEALDKQYEETAKELEQIIKAKTEAAQIKKPFGNKDEITYHKNMLDSIRATAGEIRQIADSAELDRWKASEARTEAAESLSKVANPSAEYEKARQARKAAERAQKEAEKRLANVTAYIRAEAQRIVLKISEKLPPIAKQMKNFLQDVVQFPDGRNGWELFREYQRAEYRVAEEEIKGQGEDGGRNDIEEDEGEER